MRALRDRGPAQEPRLEMPRSRGRGSHHALLRPDGAPLPRQVAARQARARPEVRPQDLPAQLCLHIRLGGRLRGRRDNVALEVMRQHRVDVATLSKM